MLLLDCFQTSLVPCICARLGLYVCAGAWGHREPSVCVLYMSGQAVPGVQEAIEDTTGAGDAFIGSVLYAITQQMPLHQMMVLGALVAACNCTALGARPALPYAADIRPKFLETNAQQSAELAVVE